MISGTHISAIYLIVVGFVVGILGGFFGVGGSFLAGPALFAAGMPVNFVIGTDLSHIVGKSIVAARTHRALGNVGHEACDDHGCRHHRRGGNGRTMHSVPKAPGER